MSVPSDDEHRREIERYRKARHDALTSPTGWLSVVGLHWLREGDNPFGGDPTLRLPLPEDRAPARAGVLQLREGTVVVRAEPGVDLTYEGRRVDTLQLRPEGQGEPTVLRLGSLALYLIEREGGIGLRVKDEESPRLREFEGVRHFPRDRGWCLQARLERDHEARNLPMPTATGSVQDRRCPGTLRFEKDGREFSLDPVQDDPNGRFLIVFGDATSGRETYGGGRYFYASPPDDAGQVELDFNKAYNPPCVFTPFATCPFPPPQNRLPVRVEAGELVYP